MLKKSANSRRNRRLRVERLEPRQLLAVVTSAGDSGPGTLRFALETGDPFVTFDVDAMGTNSIFLETQLAIDTPVTVDGEMNDIIISTANTDRCFEIMDSSPTQIPVTLKSLTLTRCRATQGVGGAIRSEENLILERVSIVGNSAIAGGGLALLGPTSIVDSKVIDNRTSTLDGGGILIATSFELVEIHKTEITQNVAEQGGGIFIAATDGNRVRITESNISNNVAENRDGGGIYIAASQGNITNVMDSTIAGNLAVEGRGGGVFFESQEGSLSINRTTVEANRSMGGSGAYVAGATAGAPTAKRLVNGTTSILNSTFSGNTGTDPFCPAAICVDSANTDISQSTISNNEGGGIEALGQFTLNVDFTTITQNRLPSNQNRGAGIDINVNATGSGTVSNSIVAENSIVSTGNDSDLAFSPGQLNVVYSLIGVNTNTPLNPSPSMPNAAGNIVGERVDPVIPNLEPLANNGGPTQTHRLLLSSIAASSARPGDARPANGPANTDQRGEQSFMACASEGDQPQYSMGSVETDVCRCDFDEDGNYTPLDMESISRHIASSPADVNLAYDINYDYEVTTDDVTSWLVQVGEADLGTPLLVGDVLNEYVDGVGFSNSCVDISDFNVWNSNKFQGNASWIDGDFNTDGTVDVSDFNLWNIARFNCVTLASPNVMLSGNQTPWLNSHRRSIRSDPRTLANTEVEVTENDRRTTQLSTYQIAPINDAITRASTPGDPDEGPASRAQSIHERNPWFAPFQSPFDQA